MYFIVTIITYAQLCRDKYINKKPGAKTLEDLNSYIRLYLESNV